MQNTYSEIFHLADLYGIKTAYLDMNNCLKTASAESLLAILKAMGAPVNSPAEVPSAIREKQLSRWKQALEPVIVLQANSTPIFNLNLPVTGNTKSLEGLLEQDNGEKQVLVWKPDFSSITNSAEIEGYRYLSISLPLPQRLPYGYHRLSLEVSGKIHRTLIISSPLKCYCPSKAEGKPWGIFLPLYALVTSRSLGSGNLSDMKTLQKWVNRLGGKIAGTLPLLASFLDSEFGPSPYMPASRLFWNEYYADIYSIPEIERCESVNKLINSEYFQKEISFLRSEKYVDYQRQMNLIRKVLELLWDFVRNEDSGRFLQFRQFIESNPLIKDYARFRAAGERNGLNWHRWPDRMQQGELVEGDFDEKSRQYHLYAQWIIHQQIEELSRNFRKSQSILYLDLPVGVHPYSYDVWRFRQSFASGVCGGAPPDPVFTGGQNWNFPPLHPEKIRHQGYEYFIKSLQHQLRYTGMLRIDHMMNFHRLFWIPEGMENRDGVYVAYRSEEMYAILALESWRNRAIIIGEDLGIVPPEVRPSMEKHGLFRMFVGQYQLISENRLGEIPARAVASLNTHDMFPFAAFWQEKDILERQKLRLINASTGLKERQQRKRMKKVLTSILKLEAGTGIRGEIETALKAVLRLLADSPAYAVLINLEDLWLEKHPQNIPGTQRKQNWSHKASRTFEQFSRSLKVKRLLKDIDFIRKSLKD